LVRTQQEAIVAASKRNPFDVPRRVAEYIRSVQADYWSVDFVEREGNRYVINFSYEEDYGYFEPSWGSDWVPDIYNYYRRDVVEFVGRQQSVELISSDSD